MFLAAEHFFVGIVIDLFICCFLFFIAGSYLYAVSAIYSCPWENCCSFQNLVFPFYFFYFIYLFSFFPCFKSNSFLNFQALDMPWSFSLKRVMTFSPEQHSKAPGKWMWGLAITTDSREIKCPSTEDSVLGWTITFPFQFLLVQWAGQNGVDPGGSAKEKSKYSARACCREELAAFQLTRFEHKEQLYLNKAIFIGKSLEKLIIQFCFPPKMGLCWAGHRERWAEVGRQGRRGCQTVARCPLGAQSSGHCCKHWQQKGWNPQGFCPARVGAVCRCALPVEEPHPHVKDL